MECKSIFIWENEAIGAPDQIVALLKEASIEGAILHSVYLSTWSTSSRIALVAALKQAGLRVYGSSGVYGATPDTEGQQAGQIVNDYNLDGFVFDAESTWDSRSTPDSNAVHLLLAYKAATNKPCAWCWWPFYKSPSTGAAWHPVKILQAAMKYADYGMPMAYWWLGDDANSAVSFLDKVWSQWRNVTDKPIIPAGRAYTGDSGTAMPEAILAYDSRARRLGAVGITWWSMQHAVKLPGIWQAIKTTPGWIRESEEPMENQYKSFALGQYVEDDGWGNASLGFVVANAGDYVNGPNPYLKPIEEKAARMKQYFIPQWDLDVTWYEDGQFNPADSYWPPESGDEPLKAFKSALLNRSFKAVIVRVMDIKMSNGKPHDPFVLHFAAKKFCERASDWLWKTKKAIMLVQSSNDYIQENSPYMSNWVGYWDSVIEEYVTSTAALDQSYPRATDKPRYYLGTHPDWDFWFYFQGSVKLYIFNGDKAKLAEMLSEPKPEPDDITPPTPPGNLAASVYGQSVTFSWSASQDNKEVKKYNAWLDGTPLQSVNALSIHIVSIAPGSHTFDVNAEDAAGNYSSLSSVTFSVPGSELGEVTLEMYNSLLARVAELERWRKS